MFWIKDKGGNLVNLELAHFIVVITRQVKGGAKYELAAFHPPEDAITVLFEGTREECLKYRDDDLYARLKEFQETNRV